MRIFLKTIVAILTLALGAVMGIYLLDGFEIVNMIVWLLACNVIGHAVYKLLRVIDKRYGHTK